MTNTNDITPEDTVDPGVDRRRMLRNVSIAAAAAAVGGAVLSSQGASAADGITITTGGTFNPSTPTILAAAADYDATTDGTGLLHVTNVPAADLPDAAQTVAISAVVDETGNGDLDTAFYGLATGTAAALDAPVPLHLLDSVSTTPPDLTVGVAGQFRQVNGALWYCAQSSSGSTPAVWLRLASADGAGGFVAIAPARVYDSRQATPGGGKISQTESRVVSVADGRGSGGAVTTPNVVPAGARAVAFNLTITETVGTFGFLSLVPGDATTAPVTSTINWDAPARTLANSGVVKLAANRTVKVFCSDSVSMGSTQFALDVTGYYL